MLMSLDDLIAGHNMDIHGVLHVGAHLAEEAPTYDRCGVGPVVWVEANPAVIPKIEDVLRAYPQQRLIEALVYSTDGARLPFNVTNYDGMSSSIFEFGTHPTFSPDTFFERTIELPTCTIDTIVDAEGIVANFLSMDIQGAELHALQGAPRFLAGVDYVMSEINRDEVYVGCAHVEDLDEYLVGFDLVDQHWVGDQGWGDGLWVRR